MPESIAALNVTLSSGAGSPTHVAPKGSLYLNQTGSSASTRLFINNGGSTWVAVTTAT